MSNKDNQLKLTDDPNITLYNKTTYLRRDYEYLRKTPIFEYDIHSAGMNILYKYKKIDKYSYEFFSSLEKNTRNRLIGKLLEKNPEWNKMMTLEFKKIIGKFMIQNEIHDDEVLSIKKDSLTIINRKVNNLIVDNLYHFDMKSEYDTFLLLTRNGEIYLNTSTMEYEIKGFGERVIQNLTDTFFNFLLTSLLIDSERKNEHELYRHFKNYRSLYLNKKLPIESYYSINEDAYIIANEIARYKLYYVDESYIDMIDISDNYSYIEKLINLILLKNKV